MRNLKLFLIALLVSTFIVSCSDDDDKTLVCKILSEYFTSDQDTRYAEYVYDDVSGLLAKINYSSHSGSDVGYYDTLFYNTSDQLIKVESWEPGSAEVNKTVNYTYTNGKITRIVETGTNWDGVQEVPYTSTADFTYSGNNLATITISGGRDNMGFKNFTYSGGNLNTVDVDFFGNDSVWTGIRAVHYDAKKNIEKNLVPQWSYIMFASSTNNYGMLLFTDSVIMGGGDQSIEIGDTLFRRSYTYNIYDQVETLSSYPSELQQNLSTITYTWECIEQ
ncbi:hypothetical protein ACFLSE_10160 [Bacteroidota bacterium]